MDAFEEALEYFKQNVFLRKGDPNNDLQVAQWFWQASLERCLEILKPYCCCHIFREGQICTYCKIAAKIRKCDKIVKGDGADRKMSDLICPYCKKHFVSDRTYRKHLRYDHEENKRLERWKCICCGRDKFQKPGPHVCNGQFRKKHLRWLRLKPEPQICLWNYSYNPKKSKTS